jgi:hypothetical protein
MRPLESFLLTYVLGAAIGVWRTDGPWETRAALALLWPIGVLAAAVTTIILLAAAAVLFPLFGLVLGAVVIGGWWIF